MGHDAMADSLGLRHLGSTGLSISPVGFGTVKIGRNLKVKNACEDGFDLPSDKQVDALLDACLSLGINLLDTAPAYGVAEERLGKLLGSRRHEFVLMSKTGERFVDGQSHYDFSYAATLASVQASLKRLNTDYLDGVMVHCDKSEMQILQQGEVLKALSDLKAKGDIRSIGWSSLSLEGGLQALEVTDFVMLAINVDYTAERPVVERAIELNKGILVKKGLLQGHLNKLPGEDPVQRCMDFAMTLPGVSSLVLGTLNLEHLHENVKKARQALA